MSSTGFQGSILSPAEEELGECAPEPFAEEGVQAEVAGSVELREEVDHVARNLEGLRVVFEGILVKEQKKTEWGWGR